MFPDTHRVIASSDMLTGGPCRGLWAGRLDVERASGRQRRLSSRRVLVSEDIPPRLAALPARGLL